MHNAGPVHVISFSSPEVQGLVKLLGPFIQGKKRQFCQTLPWCHRHFQAFGFDFHPLLFILVLQLRSISQCPLPMLPSSNW